MLNIRFTVPAYVAVSLALAISSFGQETKITKKDVPSAVLTAFRNTYPKATLRGYAKEIEEGKTYFEIESTNGSLSVDALYQGDGTLAELEEQVVPADLPAVVKEAAKAKHPDAKIAKAEKTTRGDAITYELRLTSRKTSISIVINQNGDVIKDSTFKSKNESGGRQKGG